MTDEVLQEEPIQTGTWTCACGAEFSGLEAEQGPLYTAHVADCHDAAAANQPAPEPPTPVEPLTGQVINGDDGRKYIIVNGSMYEVKA